MARRGWLESPGRLLLLALLLLAGSPASAQSPVNGCSSDNLYADLTGAGADRTLTWDLSVQSSPKRCMKVRVGQEVVWNGSFVAHPLAALGGDSPNPISNHVNGHVTFTSAGTFGYTCTIHAVMTGAIRVVASNSVPAVPPVFLVGLAIVLAGLGLRLLTRLRSSAR